MLLLKNSQHALQEPPTNTAKFPPNPPEGTPKYAIHN